MACGFSIRLFTQLSTFFAAVFPAAAELAAATVQATAAAADSPSAVHDPDAHAGNNQDDNEETEDKCRCNRAHWSLNRSKRVVVSSRVPFFPRTRK